LRYSLQLGDCVLDCGCAGGLWKFLTANDTSVPLAVCGTKPSFKRRAAKAIVFPMPINADAGITQTFRIVPKPNPLAQTDCDKFCGLALLTVVGLLLTLDANGLVDRIASCAKTRGQIYPFFGIGKRIGVVKLG